MFDTCVTLQQSFTTWRRACTTELLICSVAGRRGCLPCRPKRNLKMSRTMLCKIVLSLLSVQPFSAALLSAHPFFQCSLLSVQPSFSAAFFQCSPSFRAPVLSMQPSFNAAFFQCSLLSVQPSFNAAFFQYSLLSVQPSFTTAFFQHSLLSVQPFFPRTRSFNAAFFQYSLLSLQPFFHYTESTAFLALQPLFHYSLQSKRPGARRSV